MAIFSVSVLISRVIADHVLISQFDGNSSCDTGQVASECPLFEKARPPVCVAISDKSCGPETCSGGSPKERVGSNTPIAYGLHIRFAYQRLNLSGSVLAMVVAAVGNNLNCFAGVSGLFHLGQARINGIEHCCLGPWAEPC